MFTNKVDNKKAQSSVIGFFIGAMVAVSDLSKQIVFNDYNNKIGEIRGSNRSTASNMAGKQKLPFIEAILYCIGELRLKALQLKKVKTVAQQKVTFLKALTTANPGLKNYIKPDIQSDLIQYIKYELTQVSRCRVEYRDNHLKHEFFRSDVGQFDTIISGIKNILIM